METLKALAKSLWTNHRKKLLAFIFGLVLAALAAVTGIPLSELKEAAKDAAGVSAPLVLDAPVEAPKADVK